MLLFYFLDFLQFTYQLSIFHDLFLTPIIKILQVIVHPLKPRLGAFHGAVIIVVVWLLAALVSLPYAIYSEVRPGRGEKGRCKDKVK